MKQKNASFNNKNYLDQFCLEAHWGNCAKWSQVTWGYRNFTRGSDVIGEADITVKNQ